MIVYIYGIHYCCTHFNRIANPIGTNISENVLSTHAGTISTKVHSHSKKKIVYLDMLLTKQKVLTIYQTIFKYTNNCINI